VSQADHIIECTARWKKRMEAFGFIERFPKRRKKKKKHGVGKEKSYIAKRKAALSKKRMVANYTAAQAYHAEVKRYWNGERDDHP
jgi:hypothetical protein